MGTINAECPECRKTIELDDGCEFGFCRYCGLKIAISDCTPNLQENLEDIVKQAILALASRNMEKADSLADHALEVNVNCLDAILIKIAVAESTGSDSKGLHKLAETCTTNLGLFTRDDIARSTGYRVILKYFKKSSTHKILKGTVDGSIPLELEDGGSAEVFLSKGNHTYTFKPAMLSITLNFNVTDNGSFVITSGFGSFVIAPEGESPYGFHKNDMSNSEETVKKGLITVVLPDNPLPSQNPFIRFEIAVVNGNSPMQKGPFRKCSPGDRKSYSVEDGEIVKISFVQVDKKGLFGEKSTYDLEFKAEVGGEYRIVPEGNTYVVTKQ